jgi:hypothetical protein
MADMASLPIIGAMFGALFASMAAGIIITLAIYVYTSLALMFIAKKAGYQYPGLMWIPFVNIALIFHLGKMPWWLVFGYLLAIILAIIPFVGWVLAIIIIIALYVVGIIAWYRLCEKLGKPNWWGLLIGILYPLPILGIVSLVFMGLLAWSKTTTK